MPITVFANYFEVNTRPNLAYNRYHVEVVPVGKAPKPSRKKMTRIFKLLLEDPRFRAALSDFKSTLLTIDKIPDVPLDIVLPWKLEGEDEVKENPHEYRYTVQHTGTVSVAALIDFLRSTDSSAALFSQREEAIQALNHVIGFQPKNRTDIATLGQNKHFSTDGNPDNQFSLGGGLEALRGIFKSIRPGTGRLLLNINVSHAVCYASIRLDSLMRQFGSANLASLSKYLKRVQVARLHLPRKVNKAGVTIPNTRTIWDLASTNDGFDQEHPPQVFKNGAGPKEVKFYLDPGQSQAGASKKPSAAKATAKYVSVYDYFRENYRSVELDPKLPVVNIGSRQMPSYLPAEACYVLRGQPIGRKLNPSETRNMIEFACRKPKLNAEFIVREGRAVLGLDSPNNAALMRYGMQVGQSLVTVPARILQPPQIKYNAINSTAAKPVSKTISTRDGSWNMEGIKFSAGSSIQKWSYVWLQSTRSVAQGFQDRYSNNFNERLCHETVLRFAKFMINTGVNIATEPLLGKSGRPPIIELRDGDDVGDAKKIDNLLEAMAGAKERKPQFLLFILPYNDAGLYRKIKTSGDTKAGIHTVCVVGTKFATEKRQDQYFANVALKFNLKAGGINQMLEPAKLGIISEGQTMVVGIDVTHPQPGAKEGAPSVAGIVASIDKHLGQWPADLRIQESKKEMVSDIQSLFQSRLVLWAKKNGSLPVNVLIYRDGVSEGQFQSVLDEELPEIRKACQATYSAIQSSKGVPAISIIIVGKRHHTRFYPTSVNNADRSSNCRNGTVVDRGVTEVRNWDFFLQAHTCLQGTARPAHYYVILDEIFRGKKPKNPSHKHAADALEDLTHNMCHLFGRATKAVSICPPAYYADLLCERARCYLGRLYDPSERGNTDAGSSISGSIDVGRDEDVKIHAALKDSMFYI